MESMSDDKPIYVTSSFLPPKEDYAKLLNRIWESGVLTNNGPLVQEFEALVKDQLCLAGSPLTVTNGALGLHLILKALGGKGQVITTPFSYIATTSVPLWEGYDLVYADIDPNSLTIDPDQVEALITPDTALILATHVYGNICDVERLDEISQKYDIPVVYDAAHAYGVSYNGKSILEYGAASMVSLHATKIVHSGEGGLVYANNEELAEKIEWMRRFGHEGQNAFHGVGTNAKMSEFHAAMGLSVIPHFNEIKAKRKAVCEQYDALIDTMPKVKKAFSLRTHTDWNYAYYPVIFDSEANLLNVMKQLEENEIYPRRYFYPSLSNVGFSSDVCMPLADEYAKKVLCLPLSTAMDEHEVIRIVEFLL